MSRAVDFSSLPDQANHRSSLARSSPGRAKRKRSRRACDRCHRQACRCSPGIEGTTCTHCQEQGVPCTYDRPAKRRGPPPRQAATEEDELSATAFNGNEPPQPDEIVLSTSSPTRRNDRFNEEAFLSNPPIDEVHDYYAAYEDAIEPAKIESLVDVFYQALYPLRPYFHWPTYRSQIQRQLYRTDWGLFVVTMAVSALAARRLCDGDPIPSKPHPLRHEALNIFHQCYAAAVKAMPSEITDVTDPYHAMKAKAFLASSCLQKGDMRRAIAHLGDYISLSASTGFHLESNWPSDLTEIQRQERRRLFWGTYQADMYVSYNFGSVLRQREAKATVLYPAEVYDDEDISEMGVQLRPDRASFLRGWNFCTDLYRLLEHLDTTVRARPETSPDEPGGMVSSFLARPSENFASDCLHLVSKMHKDLPQELKKVNAVTGDPHSDRYGFIASNILITTQTLKMLLVGTEKSSVHLRCAIGSELLDELSAIPIAFFHGSSTITLQHLAHVGHLLGSAMQNPLSMWTYLQVRNILLVLAQFLDTVESVRPSSPGLAAKLRSQISRIDQFMQQTPQSNQGFGLLSMNQTLQSNLPNPSATDSVGSLDRNPAVPFRTPANNTLISDSVPSFWTTTSQPLRPPADNTIHTPSQTAKQQSMSTIPFDDALVTSGDLIFPQNHQTTLPPDLFDNWPFIFESSDPLDPFGTLSPMYETNSLALGGSGHSRLGNSNQQV